MPVVYGSIAFAATIGYQVELKATHPASIPLYQEPRGTNDFQRVPDGSKVTVIKAAPDGRWVNLSLPDGRTKLGDLALRQRRERQRYHQLVTALGEEPSAHQEGSVSASPTAIPSP